MIGENDASFTLTPIKEYDAATMTINGKARSNFSVSLANGKSAKITVKVTYLKKSKTYTFTVTRAKSTNNYLGALSVSAGALSQPFDPNVLNYTLALDENTKSTAIKASAAAGKVARVSPASSKITLNNGQSKTVKITVKAQSGAKRTYVITVVRAASTNANLKSLKAPGLSPKFSAGVTNYTVTLPANKGVAAISAAAAGYKAVVYIDGAKRSSKSIKLANGQTVTVRVTVVSQAGNANDYTITVIRQ
jgi:ribosomal protein L28